MMAATLSRVVVGVLVASFMLVLGANAGLAADDQLVVTQDESSMERVIESYLTTVHKLALNEKVLEGDDLTLEAPFKGDPMPAFRITIDTQSVNRDTETDKVIERAVLLNLLTGVTVPEDRRGAVLEVINDFNRRKLFASVYIDTDGEIICFWTLNVMKEGLPTEYVFDAVVRVRNIWNGLYPLVSEKL